MECLEIKRCVCCCEDPVPVAGGAGCVVPPRLAGQVDVGAVALLPARGAVPSGEAGRPAVRRPPPHSHEVALQPCTSCPVGTTS